MMTEKIIVHDSLELRILVNRTIIKNGPNCSLNFIDVSNITDMSFLFMNAHFSGDVSEWDVSNVKNMRGMFWQADFNADISNWDVSHVTNMSQTYRNGMFQM